MAFTAEDLDEFMRLLREDPDLRDRVRRLVLPDELLTLPELVRQNGEDIRALQAVVAQNSEDIRALQAVVAQNSEDIRAIQAVVAQNSEDIRALTSEIRELADVVRRHDVRLIRMDGRLGHLDGQAAMERWRAHYDGRFGRIVKHARLVTSRDLPLFEQAEEEQAITEDEADAVRELDIILEGTQGRGDQKRQVLLATEVSIRIEANDVSRAVARAKILERVGYSAIPVVAGALMDATLRDEAAAQGVLVLLRPGDLAPVPPDLPPGI